MLENDKTSEGLAYLARAVRLDTNNTSAAMRLYSALVCREFCRPVSELMRHDQRVTIAQFSPDGRWVVTASDDGTARIWEASTGKPASAEAMKHENPVTFAQFSPDGRHVLTVCRGFGPGGEREDQVRVWESVTSTPIGPPIKVLAITAAQFSPDGRSFVTAWEEEVLPLYGRAQVWETMTGEAVGPAIASEGGVSDV